MGAGKLLQEWVGLPKQQAHQRSSVTWKVCPKLRNNRVPLLHRVTSVAESTATEQGGEFHSFKVHRRCSPTHMRGVVQQVVSVRKNKLEEFQGLRSSCRNRPVVTELAFWAFVPGEQEFLPN